MEDHRPAGRHRISDRWRRWRSDCAGRDPDRVELAVAVRLAHALHRVGLFSRRCPSPDRGIIMKIRYFAWVRERVGKPDEEVDLPAGIATISELMSWLARRGDEYCRAFENPRAVRAAIDHVHV